MQDVTGLGAEGQDILSETCPLTPPPAWHPPHLDVVRFRLDDITAAGTDVWVTDWMQALPHAPTTGALSIFRVNLRHCGA